MVGVLGVLRRVALGSLPFLVAFLRSPLPLQSAEYSLEEIVQSLRDWNDSFVNLSFRYSRWSARYGAKPVHEGTYFVEDWVKCDDGRSRHESRRVENGATPMNWRVSVRNPRASDFTASYSLIDGTDVLESLVAYNHIPSRTQRPGRTKFLPVSANLPIAAMYNAHDGEPLHEVLRGLGVVVHEIERIDSCDCLRVSVDTTMLWLDPSVGFLPRKVKARIPSAVEEYLVWQCHEFQEFVPGFSFPSRGSRELSVQPKDETQLWQVESVSLNSNLADDLFQTPKNKPSALSRSEPDKAIETVPLNKRADALIPRSHRLWWPIGFAGLSVVLFVVAWVFRRRA